MLNHHEPITIDVDFASLPADQREAIVQAAIRRAHAERAKAIGNMVKRLFRLATFWRADRGGNAPGTSPNYARHA
jgi:hypothetical protein